MANERKEKIYSDKSINIYELLKGNYVIICDTNVYLGLYGLSPDYANFALECLKSLKEYLILPYTVKIEYKRHCINHYQKRQKAMEYTADDIKKLADLQKNAMMNNISTLVKRQFPEIEELQTMVEEKFQEIKNLLTDYFDNRSVLDLLKDSWDEDYIDALINELCLMGNLMKDIPRDEVYRICEDGEKRYKKEIPPGFKDAKNKDGIRKYSDLILWNEVIKYAHDKQKNIIFVTDDLKPDWWNIENGKYEFLPRLISEFKKKTKLRNKENIDVKHVELEIIPFVSVDFFEAVANSLKIDKTDAVEQALKLTQEDYIQSIEYSAFDAILVDLQYSGTNYVDTNVLTQIGSEGIGEWEIESYTLDGYEIIQREEECIIYDLIYNVEMSGYSYDYWGRDDDTREVVLSPPFKHEISGTVVVRVVRKANVFMDFESDEFEEAEIFSTEFDEIYFKSAYADPEGYDLESYTVCPDCNTPISHINDGGNGFCIDCALNH